MLIFKSVKGVKNFAQTATVLWLAKISVTIRVLCYEKWNLQSDISIAVNDLVQSPPAGPGHWVQVYSEIVTALEMNGKMTQVMNKIINQIYGLLFTNIDEEKKIKMQQIL